MRGFIQPCRVPKGVQSKSHALQGPVREETGLLMASTEIAFVHTIC